MTQQQAPAFGSASYNLPLRVCVSCGRLTAGKTGGAGDYHWTCKRDERGNLLTKPLPTKTKAGAA